jgi:aspartyl-tRNA(Asn)/glutamyl-tRNA(Gln) amidotransferase subunit C
VTRACDTIPTVEKLTSDEVARLARLARLDLSHAEIELFTRQLREILAFAHQIDAVDTSADLEATPGPAAAGDTLRDDALMPSLDRDQVLELAPDADREAGLFKVPRVFNR